MHPRPARGRGRAAVGRCVDCNAAAASPWRPSGGPAGRTRNQAASLRPQEAPARRPWPWAPVPRFARPAGTTWDGRRRPSRILDPDPRHRKTNNFIPLTRYSGDSRDNRRAWVAARGRIRGSRNVETSTNFYRPMSMRAHPATKYVRAGPQTWGRIREAYLSGLSAPTGPTDRPRGSGPRSGDRRGHTWSRGGRAWTLACRNLSMSRHFGTRESCHEPRPRRVDCPDCPRSSGSGV